MKVIRYSLYAVLAVLVLYTAGLYEDVLEAQSPPVPTRLLYTGVTSTTLSTNTQMLSAPANGLRYYISDVECVNSSSTASAAQINDGTSTAIWRIPCPPSGVAGGYRHFDPPLRQPTSATAVGMNVSAAGSTNYLSIRAYQDK